MAAVSPNHINYTENSTSDLNQSLALEPDVLMPGRLYDVTVGLVTYVQPVICLFGIVGNSVSFVVFLSEKMRRVSTNIYLAALSASNSVFLVALGVAWTDSVGMTFMHRHGICQAIVYLTYCSAFLSVWLVVCITIENFIINFFLHKASTHCAVRKALGLVVFLIVTALLLYDFAIWTTTVVVDPGTGRSYCIVIEGYKSVLEIYTCIDVAITLILPSVIILSLVIPTCVKNICCRRTTGVPSTSIILSRKERALLRVTRLLCVIIVSFVVLSGPSSLNKLRHLFVGNSKSNSQPSGTDVLVQYFCQVFYYLSFSVNFVYFLVWGKNFRQRFCHMFGSVYKFLCRCRRNPSTHR
ncbi:hypothetical protein BaRGS_00009522 [Batillaria attramentaria]|uniref:G-protein coupled receptors family 1 profile domain-containing protein n=1 Tax=Batillaria attramentaria TaxID=370345 RepID=A0ABD0LI84_9CAEN|nr:hypothetical protein BaRGS_021130 [Batillaria attramentaria]